MSAPTWGDEVKIKKSAAAAQRPGAFASVCGMRQVETAEQAQQFGCAVGATLLTVEFSDGSSIEIPEVLVEVSNEP